MLMARKDNICGLKKQAVNQAMVAHACNPSYLGG
jgi:hypothetical protein